MSPHGAIVAIVGAGGAIGSHLVLHVARMAGVAEVRLIEPDTYEPRNLRSQDITPADVGRLKVLVQAARMQRVNPALVVTALAERVEHVPLGLLRADVILACLDGRAARRTLGAAAWRLGVPWIDAGVRRDGLLVRLAVHRPGPEQPCYECAFEPGDQAREATTHPCDPTTPATPAPTDAPSALGALAAALQALECAKILAGAWDDVAVGREVTLSALGHTHLVSRTTRNPDCRFAHDRWTIAPLDRAAGALTVDAAFRLTASTGAAAVRLQVASQPFVRVLTCPACGMRRDLGLALLGRLAASLRACPACGTPMRAAGGDALDWLTMDDVPEALRRVPLDRVGVRTGDVLGLAGSAGVVRFEIAGGVA